MQPADVESIPEKSQIVEWPARLSSGYSEARRARASGAIAAETRRRLRRRRLSMQLSSEKNGAARVWPPQNVLDALPRDHCVFGMLVAYFWLITSIKAFATRTWVDDDG